MRGAGDRRVLATVLFTDIVRSTDIAVELGDARWKELLRRHHIVIRRELKRFGGREIDNAGDGFFAIFDSPAGAVRCADACVDGARALGVEIRAGLHTGEIEFEGTNVRGVAVHLGARVMATAGAGETMVTGTLHDVVSGSGLGFEDRGMHELKGVPGTWQLWLLSSIDGRSVTSPPREDDAAILRAKIEPSERARRRALVVGGVAGLVVVAGLAIVLLSSGRDHDPGARGTAPGPRTGDVIEFDPASGEILLAEATGVLPTHTKGISIARGEGSIWVDSKEDTTLTKLDEETGGFDDEYPIDYAGSGIFVESPWVWVPVENALLRVTPQTGDTESVIEFPSSLSLPATAGDGSIWVFSNGEVTRVDALTGEVIDVFEVDADVQALAFGEGALWAIDKLNSELVRIDPRTGKPGMSVQLPGNLDAVIVGEGSAWVLDETAGTIAAVDADTGDVRASLRVGEQPSGMAFGLGALWVGDLEAPEIWRIDPLSFQAAKVDTPAPVAAIVADEGDHALWFALSSERTATQF